MEIVAGETRTLELSLERFMDLPARGWYSGDNHIHMNYGGIFGSTPKSLLLEAEAEDVHVINDLIANHNSRIIDLQYFQGKPHPLSNSSRILYFNQEFRPSFPGHLSLLNLKEYFFPSYTSYVGTPHEAYHPTNTQVLDAVHAQGAVGGYVHPFYGDEGKFPRRSKEFPVTVALGELDYYDGGAARQLTDGDAEDYYPRWSPDGREIVFHSLRSGNMDVWVIPADGGEARQITDDLEGDFSPQWLPHGNSLVFTTDRTGSDSPSFVESRRVGRPRREAHRRPGVVLRVLAGRCACLFRRLRRQSGKPWRVPAGGGGARRMTELEGKPGALGNAALATDGEHLYFAWEEDLGDIWVMDVVTDEGERSAAPHPTSGSRRSSARAALARSIWPMRDVRSSVITNMRSARIPPGDWDYTLTWLRRSPVAHRRASS